MPEIFVTLKTRMDIHFPPKGSALESLVVSALENTGARALENGIPVFLPQAKADAARYFETSGAKGRRAYLVLRPDDDMLILVTVGERGGVKVEWEFGVFEVTVQ